MSILDIIIFSVGGLIVILYGYFAIRKTIKWKKSVRKYLAEGYTLQQAKDKANIDYNFKQKKNKKTDNPSKIVEDDLFTE